MFELGDDGYPTEETLTEIRDWDCIARGNRELLDAIKPIWNYADFGFWHTEDAKDILDSDVVHYHISTGGWSGNEDIIYALKKNWLFWGMSWLQSRRGGHYIFEFKVKNEERFE